MGIFDKPPRMITEEEKQKNIEKYRVVRPLTAKPIEENKDFARKEIAKNDPEFARKKNYNELLSLGYTNDE